MSPGSHPQRAELLKAAVEVASSRVPRRHKASRRRADATGSSTAMRSRTPDPPRFPSGFATGGAPARAASSIARATPAPRVRGSMRSSRGHEATISGPRSSKGRAAAKTIERRAAPTTEEGRQARSAVITRRDAAQETAKRLIDEIVRDARVFQGGGSEVEAPGNNPGIAGALPARSTTPSSACTRNSRWPTFDRLGASSSSLPAKGARRRSLPSDIEANPNTHPVARAVLAQVAPGRHSVDSRSRKHFAAPPYGWSKDAIDGALLGLTGDRQS